MENNCAIAMRELCRLASFTLCLAALAPSMAAQAPASTQTQSQPAVPAWAQPGLVTHAQVAPPAGFHRATTTFNTPIGIFDGQSDVGSAVLPGSASFDAASGNYTITRPATTCGTRAMSFAFCGGR